MKIKQIKKIILLLVLYALNACGPKLEEKKVIDQNEQREEEGEEEEIVMIDGSNIEGHYQAKFITLNPHVNGTLPGSANFYREENRFYAYVRLFAGGIRAWHMQNVYNGNRCPTIHDDKNNDGFIDINEAEVVLGKILIPLDSDIGHQLSGRRYFPVGDLSGSYQYERVTSFNRFLSDLQSSDMDLEDDLIKLPPGEGLKITGRAVLIQGVASSVEFPETVETKGKHETFKTLPIACGIFSKVKNSPGLPYIQDQIPGPIADVDSDQDKPNSEVIPEDGSDGPSGNETNDSHESGGPVSDESGNTTENEESENSEPGLETENGENRYEEESLLKYPRFSI